MILTEQIKFHNIKALTGKLRPSGRFSVVQLPASKNKGFSNVKVQKQKDTALLNVSELDANYERLCQGQEGDLSTVRKHDRSCGGALGLSIGTNSRIRASRGSRGISSRQRDLLCWGANALERAYGKKCLSFVTFTLPNLSERDFDAVRANWSDVVHRVIWSIRRKIDAKGYKSAVVGCTELQLERAEKTGRYYPHLHLVLRGRSSIGSHWSLQPHQFRRIWRLCVSKFLLDGVDTWAASENVQPVRKSVAGYLSKYISKCASKSVSGVLDLWHPSDWILVSRKIRWLYEHLTYTGYELGYTLLGIVKSWKQGIGYVRPIIISTPAYGDRRIGYYGWLKGEERWPSYLDVHPATV